MGQLEQQMRHRDKEMVPRVLVQAMFGIMLGALLIVAYARLTDRPLEGVATFSPVIAERVLTLQGTRDGTVTVLDESGAVVARSDQEKKGFIGVIWRSIDRQRMLEAASATAPVRLVLRENGKFAVLDTVTDWSIELVGYGQDNVAAFATLID